MTRIRFTAAYDGRPYLGWQSQPGGRTVQDVLERAFSGLFGTPCRIHGSGRTDAGVHALGQVFHADAPDTHRIPADKWPAALNTRLPRTIRITHAEYVPPGFHARFSATGKPTVTAFHAHPSSTLLTPGWPGTARWHGAWIFWNRRYTYSGERMTSLLLPPCAAMNRALFRRVTSAEPSRRHKWHRQGNMSSSPLPERASSTNGAPHDGSRP